jgi:hypothetical protein
MALKALPPSDLTCGEGLLLPYNQALFLRYNSFSLNNKHSWP